MIKNVGHLFRQQCFKQKYSFEFKNYRKAHELCKQETNENEALIVFKKSPTKGFFQSFSNFFLIALSNSCFRDDLKIIIVIIIIKNNYILLFVVVFIA